MKVRTFAHRRRMFVFFVVAVIEAGANGAFDMRHDGPPEAASPTSSESW